MSCMAQPIENHAVIGDLRTAALVANDGTIDFLCWPRFDSPSVFASLLDDERGGSFCLAPALDGGRHRQLYLPDTNVLLTRLMAHGGVSEICDFFNHATVEPGAAAPVQRLVRRVKAVMGPVTFRLRCAPRFDYGRASHRLELATPREAVFTPDGDGTALRLWSTVPLVSDGEDVVAEFTLETGESAAFVLEDAALEAGDPTQASWIAESFKTTSNTWRAWANETSYHGRWAAEVRRSALALKLLTCAEHGSMVAAVTFGLPEEVGGERNWDYRYTWLRDSAFIAYAFLRVGHTDEARAFGDWLNAREAEAGASGEMKIMYAVDGRDVPHETELDHLRGYLDSTPVRIGNGANDLLQLDIYGELLDAIYLTDAHVAQISYESWTVVRRIVGYVMENWERKDEGIWEVRGGQQHFLHSRLMCWVAMDRAVRLSDKRGLPAPIEEWRRVRDAIHHDIHDNFYNRELGAFVQTKGGDTLDASCLLMPLLRFIGATDPRWLSTMRALEKQLVVDSLVYRYRGDGDGLSGEEGTFTMCSFWYVECLARAGDLDRARFMFDKMLGYANEVGLFAEELGHAGEHLGNFPQAFTHLALISAATTLDREIAARA